MATVLNSVPHTLDVDSEAGSTVYLGSGQSVNSLIFNGNVALITPSGARQKLYFNALTVDLNTFTIPTAGMQFEGPELDLIGASDGNSHSILVGPSSSTVDGKVIYYFPGTRVLYTPGASNTALAVDGGSVTVTSDVPSGGLLTLETSAGGSVEIDSTVHLVGLVVNAGGTARMGGAGDHILVTDSLIVAGSAGTSGGGLLDLADNDLIDRAGDANTIAALIVAGI